MRIFENDEKLVYMAAARLTAKEGRKWRRFITAQGERQGSAVLRKLILREIANHDSKKVKANG